MLYLVPIVPGWSYRWAGLIRCPRPHRLPWACATACAHPLLPPAPVPSPALASMAMHVRACAGPALQGLPLLHAAVHLCPRLPAVPKKGPAHLQASRGCACMQPGVQPITRTLTGGQHFVGMPTCAPACTHPRVRAQLPHGPASVPDPNCAHQPLFFCYHRPVHDVAPAHPPDDGPGGWRQGQARPVCSPTPVCSPQPLL